MYENQHNVISVQHYAIDLKAEIMYNGFIIGCVYAFK